MLAQSNSVLPAAVPHSVRMQQTGAIWDAIEQALRALSIATTREIADAVGLSPSQAQARLMDLREMGEVRHATLPGRAVRAWSLGAEEFAARAERMTPLVTKARQLGTFRRDPLVAALFGVPGEATAPVQAVA